jgi:hypothetical protein
MRLVSGSRPAALLSVVLGALLALTTVPVLAGPAHAATVVVSGKVTGPDALGATVPVENVFVEANQANGNSLDPRVYDYTAADGTYSLTLPDTGTYQITVECANGSACAQTYAPDPTSTQTVSSSTVLNASLERWGKITGTVKKNGVATAWPNGTVMANNDARNYWDNYPGVAVGSNGQFTIEKVAPGTVTMTGTEGYDVENFLSIVAGQSFAVAPGATTDISLAVEDWPGLYVAAVDPATGDPLSGMAWNVYSRPAGSQVWDNGLQYGPLRTDENGRMSYRIPDKTREYTVCFAGETDVPVSERRLKRCYGDAPDLAGASAWKHSVAQPKLRTSVALPLPFTTAPTPTVSGTAKVGSTLTANPGTWSPAPTTTTYAWLREGVAINGATAATYQPVTADLGKKLSVRVTSARAGYETTSKTSAATAAVAPGTFTTAPTPTISGTVAVGSTMTANPGTWVPAATTTTYQWLRAGVEIPGATQQSYVLTAADAGMTLTVKVTGARDGYETTTKTSLPTAAAADGAFSTVPTPTVTGSTAVGSTLTANPGTWVPAATTTTYQWLRSGVEIPGATGQTYRLTAADAGAALTVRVTGGRDGYAETTATSAATAAVGLATFDQAPAPRIKGKAKVRAKLKAVVGTWSPTPATTTYQWYRNGKAIKGATGATYKVTRKDSRKRITVVVTQALPGYATVSQKSPATKRVR